VGFALRSTARGGLKEVVDNGRTTIVVEPDGKEFSAAMLRLLDDASLREELGRAGRREIEARLSAEQMVENTIRVYEDVLRKWQSR
jgi:glycosyltransferase involved in cell wall biosynthesis